MVFRSFRISNGLLMGSVLEEQVLSVAVLLLVCLTVTSGKAPVCEFFVSTELPENFDVGVWRIESGNVSVATNSVVCDNPDYNTCMVLWLCDSHADANCTSQTPLIKGCWNGAGQPDCQRDLCIDNGNPNRSDKIVPNSRFCCCSTDRCNEEFMFIYQPPPASDSHSTEIGGAIRLAASQQVVTIVTVCILLSLCVVAGVFICYRMWMWKSWQINNRLKDEKSALLTGNGGPTTDYLCLPLPIQPVGDFDLDQIALLECVGHGRYGNVWRAVDTTDSLKRLIAVKIYQLNSQCNAKIFLNECQVYNLPFMAEHRNLLDFYGAREKVFEPQMFDSPPGSGLDEFEMGSSGNMTGPRREGWLFLSYNSGGTLQEFLKGNTVTWTQFCSMGSSITSGLAFLHSELKREGLRKPPIVHRDINSFNVLVQPNKMTCVICDMGFALAIDMSKLKTEDSSEASIAEVGTLRYLAPEVLEGAVNLRDPEIALKNVDIYAMALVLWEILSRCADIHMLTSGTDVPEYQLPYQKYLDIRQNSLEQMQLCVCRKKIRPLLPAAVMNLSQLKCVKEVIEECWDQDSEARLTALCAQERFQDLLNNRSGLIAAITNAGRADVNTGGVDLQYINSCPNSGVHRTNAVSPWPSGDSTGTSGIGSMAGDGSFKDNTANSHSSYAPVGTPPLQPFEGRNLCNERNIISEPSDESGIESRITESSCLKLDPDAMVSPFKGPNICSPRAQRPYSVVAMPSHSQVDQNFTNILTGSNMSTTEENSTVSSVGSSGTVASKKAGRNWVLSWLTRGISSDKRNHPIEEVRGVADGSIIGSPKMRNVTQRVKNTNTTATGNAPINTDSVQNVLHERNINGAKAVSSASQRKRSRSLENFITTNLNSDMNETGEETVVVMVESSLNGSGRETGVI